MDDVHEVGSKDPADPNVTPTRRRVSPADSTRMRELAEQIQGMLDELGNLTRSYTDLDDDDRTEYRFTPNRSRAHDNAGIYIEIVDGWSGGVPKTACFVYCQGADGAAYVECPCGSGALLC